MALEQLANADKAYNEAVYEGIKDTPKIAELEWENTSAYDVVDKEVSLKEILEAQVIMVAGAFFGDEAKGKTVDAIAEDPRIKVVSRVNSGENAGHTVYNNGKKFVFHLTPSGVFSGKLNLIGPECVMDPVSWMNVEIQQLSDAGIDYRDMIYVGNVQIVTPYHKLLDFLLSAANSSTLKGMSPVHSCKATKRGIRMDHLFGDPKVCEGRLRKDMQTYESVMKYQNKSNADLLRECEALNADGNIRMPLHVIDFVKADDKIKYMMDLYREYVVENPKFPARKDVTYEIRKFLQAGDKVLLEGPQSYWLANTSEKFWESSTSADTAAVGLQATARFNVQRYKSVVINVHKTPGSSRVGIGANPGAYVAQDYFSRQDIITLKQFGDRCRKFDDIQRVYSQSIQANGVVKPGVYSDDGVEFGTGVAMAIGAALAHGECGATTLKPRVCGFFDCVLHFEVNEVQGPYLSVSCFDRGDEYDKIGVVVAYVYHSPQGVECVSNGRTYTNGTIIKAGDAIPTESVLKHCHPIVKQVNGWKDTPMAATKRQPGTPLPKGAMDLIGTIEHFTGAQIISIGNGPNGEDLIYIQKK